MDVAGLVAWIVTALGGSVLLARWIGAGGVAQQRTGATRFPVGLVFGHVGLAVAGLVVWILYLATDSDALAWVAVVLLLGIALLGATMFARWSRRTRRPAGGGEAAAEDALPPLVVYGHGLLAVTTLTLVVLAALGVGESS